MDAPFDARRALATTPRPLGEAAPSERSKAWRVLERTFHGHAERKGVTAVSGSLT